MFAPMATDAPQERSLRAAQIRDLGALPVVADVPARAAAPGTELVRVLVVALNPVDLAIGSGRFYGGHPPLPYVPGHEAVVQRSDGSLAYVSGDGLGIARDGTLVETVAVRPELLRAVPSAADPAVAVGLGTAGLAGWLAVTWRAAVGPGDVVVVLGATGSVGRIAVHAAVTAGAARVVAVGRSSDRLAGLGLADGCTVTIGDGLADRVLRAAGSAPTVLIDTTWGPNLVELLGVMAPRARVVNLGASGGAIAEIPSAAIRGRQLDLLGYSNFGVPTEVANAAHLELVRRSMDGAVALQIERFPLEHVGIAWARAAEGVSKVVVDIGAP